MEKNENTALTEKDFNEFLSATGNEQWKILLAHAERNKKIIQIRRIKTMEQNTNQSYEEISKQFEEFCQTKGIAAKFKVAFANMAENTRKQREADKAHFEEVKRQSAEANPEFTELLHTKGFKAKVKLFIENIKKGAKESNEKVRKQIEASKHGVPSVSVRTYSAEELAREFNEFLKAKGLDGYAVEVTGGDDND
ncbi:MAG: hypothetical protein K2K80_00475 [Clostridia bacterium]|nr:hypothetical protein [Clostridia bacterium]